MMLRSFLPVGQGAFYTECFKCGDRKYNIVYDCGSSTKGFSIENQIKRTFDKNEIIDAIFISHLHDDHINGLPSLIKHCQVKKIFFPLITEDDKNYLILPHLLTNENDKFLVDFINNPNETINNINKEFDTQLFQVAPVIDNDDNNNNNYEDTRGSIIPSGDNIAQLIFDHITSKDYWEYVPFNFLQKERLEQLKQAMYTQFGSETLPADVIKKYGKYKNKIKAAYSKVKGGFNINSLTLFSGKRDRHSWQREAICNRCLYCCHAPQKSGCLYLGDYDAYTPITYDSLKNKYDKYWNYIGCIQIPHHGSMYSYNKELSKLNAYTVISAGYSNNYHHPHATVVRDLLLNKCNLSIVTEQVGSRVDFIVDY